MLILSRRAKRAIVIGDDIKVTIVSTNRRKGIVRIAIEAPGYVPIDRHSPALREAMRQRIRPRREINYNR